MSAVSIAINFYLHHEQNITVKMTTKDDVMTTKFSALIATPSTVADYTFFGKYIIEEGEITCRKLFLFIIFYRVVLYCY